MQTTKLVLMRHGLALSAHDSGSTGDAGRKLSEDGKAQIAVSSRQLREIGVSPGLIVSSPFRRAVETADIAAEYFPASRRAVEPALVSADFLPDILDALAAAADGEQAVLVVGHQPTLGSLCGLLLGTDGRPFGAGSFAYLKIPGGLRPGGGSGRGKAELAYFFSPENV